MTRPPVYNVFKFAQYLSEKLKIENLRSNTGYIQGGSFRLPRASQGVNWYTYTPNSNPVKWGGWISTPGYYRSGF